MLADSGAAFQVINLFLRQISNLTGDFRTEVTCSPSLTFAATVGHICRAVRKLAAVATPEEAEAPLYRGVRGELPRTFWVPDKQGMVCAVDMAFMSITSGIELPRSPSFFFKALLTLLLRQAQVETATLHYRTCRTMGIMCCGNCSHR